MMCSGVFVAQNYELSSRTLFLFSETSHEISHDACLPSLSLSRVVWFKFHEQRGKKWGLKHFGIVVFPADWLFISWT